MINESINFLIPELGVHVKRMEIKENANLIGVHFHDAVELVYIDSGEIICSVDESDLILKEGDILLLNKRTIHNIQFYRVNSIITYIQIDIGRYEELNKNDFDFPFLKSGLLTYKMFFKNDDVERIFNDIIKEAALKRVYYENYIKADVFRIYAIMLRCGMTAYDIKSEERGKIKKIMPAVKYAEENIGEKISVDKAASLVGVNKFHFCKIFKNAVGMTFIEYVNFLRLKKVEKLLLNTEKSISEIAYDCGFESIQYFNRKFKSKFGYTPREFRDMNFIMY